MKTNSLTATLLLAAAIAAPLRAQDERSPLSLIPADPFFLQWCDGPKKLGATYGETRLADMLGGPEIMGMLTPMMEMLRGHADEAGVDAQVFEEALLDYEGRAFTAFGFDGEGLDFAMDGPEALANAKPWVICIFSSDGHTDLAGLQERLAEMIETAHGDELADLTLEGRTFRVIEDQESSAKLTLPFMEGPHLVVVFGAPLEAALSKSLLNEGESLEDGQRSIPPGDMGGQVDLAPLWKIIDMAADDEAPFLADFLAECGLKALQNLSISTRASGEHVVFDFDVGFGGENLGMFAAMTEVPAGEPALLDLAPVQRQVWSVTKMNLGVVYDALMNALGAMEPMTQMTRADMEDQFAEMFRVRLKEDLIDHIGAEILTVGPTEAPADDDERTEISGMEGACYALAMRDAKSFDAAFETVLRSRGLHAARKTEEYRGFKVRKLMVLGMLELYYAVTDRLFLIGLGKAGAVELRAVLDEEKDRSEGKARAALPGEVAGRLEHAAKGWQSLSVASLSSTLAPAIAAFEQSGEMPPAVTAQVKAAASMVVGLVKRYGLNTMVSVTNANKGRLKLQLIW